MAITNMEFGSTGIPSLEVKKSFKDVLFSGSELVSEDLAGYVNLPANLLKFADGAGIKIPSTHNGMPAILLSDSELSLLEAPLKFTLIGKFISGRPKWMIIVNFFRELKLTGVYKLAYLDSNHFVIHLHSDEDYIRIFSKSVFFIHGFMLKILKWNIQFDIHEEPSIIPVWISLPFLGLHLYTPELLFSIASVCGKPLKLDYASCNWSRPAFARVLVEIDLRKDLKSEVWVGSENTGYIQPIVYENIPVYCLHCRCFGHSDDECFVLHPDLKKQYMLNRTKHRSQVSNEVVVQQAVVQQERNIDLQENLAVAQQPEMHSEGSQKYVKVLTTSSNHCDRLDLQENLAASEIPIDSKKEIWNAFVESDTVCILQTRKEIQITQPVNERQLANLSNPEL